MENDEQEFIIDSEQENNDIGDDQQESQTEEKVVKPKRTPEEELAYFEGRAKRLRKDLGLDEAPVKPKKDKPAQKSDDLDYGQKAFLRAEGIKGADELNLVKNWIERTGDDLESVIEDEIFQARLKNLRDAKATAEATPKGSKRASQPITNDIKYWLTKPFDEVPPEMKREVLNAKIEQQKTGGQFSQNPVVIGGSSIS